MRCGFGKVDITPKVGCRLAGYPQVRVSEGVADPLYIRAVAFEEGALSLIMTCDMVGLCCSIATRLRSGIANALGCRIEQVNIAATHSHYTPYSDRAPDASTEEFLATLEEKAIGAAREAVEDLQEAELRFAQDTLPGISFVRRYRMKDGSVQTNPGRCNPNVIGPVSEGDDTLQLLRICRESGDILMVGFQVHPDVRRGLLISADYPGAVCRELEEALPGCKAIYINGTCGDLNHIDVKCPSKAFNGGPGHVAYMGRAIAGKALHLYPVAHPIMAGPVRTAGRLLQLPQKQVSEEQLKQALDYIRWHEAGETDKIPYRDMQYITAVNQSYRIRKIAEYGGDIEAPVCAAGMGQLAFVTVPGEGFCAIGKQLRTNSPFIATFVMNTCNAYEGYFPTREAYEQGSYETSNSSFPAGIAELLTDTGAKLLQQVHDCK